MLLGQSDRGRGRFGLERPEAVVLKEVAGQLQVLVVVLHDEDQRLRPSHPHATRSPQKRRTNSTNSAGENDALAAR